MISEVFFSIFELIVYWENESKLFIKFRDEFVTVVIIGEVNIKQSLVNQIVPRLDGCLCHALFFFESLRRMHFDVYLDCQMDTVY